MGLSCNLSKTKYVRWTLQARERHPVRKVHSAGVQRLGRVGTLAHLLRRSSSTLEGWWPPPYSDLGSLESAKGWKKRPVSSTPGQTKAKGPRSASPWMDKHQRWTKNTSLIPPQSGEGWPKGLWLPHSAPGPLIAWGWQQAELFEYSVPNPFLLIVQWMTWKLGYLLNTGQEQLRGHCPASYWKDSLQGLDFDVGEGKRGKAPKILFPSVSHSTNF